MNKTTTTLVAAAAAVLLTACGGMGGETTDSPTSGSNKSEPTVTVTETEPPAEAPAEAEPEPSLTGEDPGILTLGETFTYSDGLQITVSKPNTVQTSYGPAVSFDVTIVNGTDGRYDPSMDFFYAQVGNAEAEEVFDTENGYEGTPMTTLLPGREAIYKVAFEGTDTENLVLEFVPGDFDRGSLIYTPDGK